MCCGWTATPHSPSLDKQGKLAPYTPAARFNPIGQALVPTNHSYVPASATVVAALIYNSAKTTKVPASYEDLLGPDYTGTVGMNDPAQSGPTFPLIAGLMNQMGGQTNGVTAGEDYLKKLKANGLKVFPTNGDTLHALETGQISYGLIQSSAATGEVATAPKSAEFNAKVIYLPQSTLLPSAIGIDKAADPATQDEAKKFVDFVLSPAGQAVMQTATHRRLAVLAGRAGREHTSAIAPVSLRPTKRSTRTSGDRCRARSILL